MTPANISFFICFCCIIAQASLDTRFQKPKDHAMAQPPSGENDRQNPVIVLRLNGSMYQMGKSYGEMLSQELHNSLRILIEFFENQGQTYEKLIQLADAFQERCTNEWDQFLQGVAIGSGLSYNDCKILNAMETLQVPDAGTEIKGPSPHSLLSGCAFVFIPGSNTKSGHPLISRNYDYPPPFNDIAKSLIVTILHQEGFIPTAIVGLPGQIYCPTCVNAKNYFLELNNGAPSGGAGVDQSIKPSMLIRMLDLMRTAADFDVLIDELTSIRSDYSLIVNAASFHGGSSFEYSMQNSAVKVLEFDKNETFISTNYFLHPLWLLPTPVDEETFVGVTRRQNLVQVLNEYRRLSITDLKNIMEIDLIDGGAKWIMTIYQILYDYDTRILSLKVPNVSDEWVDIDLNGLLFR